MPVLVVTGVAREAKIAAGPGVETICSGGSPARLRGQLGAQQPEGLTAAISFGIAGGLNPGLASGHVVVADAVVAEDKRHAADVPIADALIRALSEVGGLRILRASIAGVDKALLDPHAKSVARANTNA